MKYWDKEIIIRTLEMLVLGAICSVVQRFAALLGLYRLLPSFYFGIALFVCFQAVNIWLCRKSNRRMHHSKKRYYTSNLLALVIYAGIGFLVYFGGFGFIFTYLFSITLSLTRRTTQNDTYFLLAYFRFFATSAIVIVLAKKLKYMIRACRFRGKSKD